MTAGLVEIGSFLTPAKRDEPVDRRAIYPMMGVRSFGRGPFAASPLSGDATSYSILRKVEEGDVVYPKLMAWEGAFALVPPELAGRWVSPEFCIFEVDDSVADPRYVSHLMAWEGLQKSLLGQSSGTNARRRRLQPHAFLIHRVPMRDLPEQRRIADHLDFVSRNVARLTERRWHKTQPPTAMLPPLLASALEATDTPAAPLAELCRSTTRVVHPHDDRRGATEFIGLEHIESHTGRRLSLRPLVEEKGRKLLFNAHEITYGYLRPYLNKVWLTDRTGLCSVEQYVLVPTDGVDPTLLSYVLRSDLVLKEAVSATHSLQLPRLRLDRLMSIQVPDIRRIGDPLTVCRQLDELNACVTQLAGTLQKRSALVDGLLPAARNEVFSALR